MADQIKEAIELLEKAIDWCQRAPDGIPIGILLNIDQARALLRAEQPPAGDFTKKTRDWIQSNHYLDTKHSLPDFVRLAGVLLEACDRLDTETQRADKAEVKNKSQAEQEKMDMETIGQLDKEIKLLEAKLKEKDELLFVYESVRAPKKEGGE